MATLQLQPVTMRLTPGTVYDKIEGLVAPWSALPKGCNLIGREDIDEPYPVIRYSSNQGYFAKALHDNFRMSGIAVEGGGLFVEGNNGINIGGRINDVEFRLNPTGGAKKNGLQWSCRPQDWDVTNCLFTGYSGGGLGMYGDRGYYDLYIANNEFIDITGGMHIDALGGPGNGMLIVEQNYVRGAKGMGFEFQSTAEDLIFRDNFFEKPNLTANYNDNKNSMAFSLILDKSRKIRIYRNTVLAPEKPDGVGCRIGFEVGGDDSVIEDNYVNGINHVLAMNDGVDTASVIVRNNRFLNFKEGVSNSFPSSVRTLTETNNGPNVVLTWDINRARPARFVRYGTTPPTPVPVPPQYIDDPITEVTVKQKSGRVTVTKP